MKHAQHINISQADIYVYPQLIKDPFTVVQTPESPFERGDEWTLPLLHGNIMKLLYSLICHEFIEICPSLYKKNTNEKIGLNIFSIYSALATIYTKRIQHLTLRDIIKFKKLVNTIVVKDRYTLLRIFGMLATAGQNDFFTLYLLSHLIKQGLKIEIILSENDLEFICAYERYFRFDKLPEFYKDEEHRAKYKSLHNLIFLFDNMWITKKEIKQLYEKTYRSKIKLLGGSLNAKKDKLTIYSYGEIDEEIIKRTAKHVRTDYFDSSHPCFANTIERINYMYQVVALNENIVHLTLGKEKPIVEIVCDADKKDKKDENNGELENIRFVSSSKMQDELGSTLFSNKGLYKVQCTRFYSFEAYKSNEDWKKLMTSKPYKRMSAPVPRDFLVDEGESSLSERLGACSL